MSVFLSVNSSESRMFDFSAAQLQMPSRCWLSVRILEKWIVTVTPSWLSQFQSSMCHRSHTIGTVSWLAL
jgi:hypothetical protein